VPRGTRGSLRRWSGFDVIFDTVGGETLDTSFAAVRTYTGHVVSILGSGTHSLAPLSFRGATYSGAFTALLDLLRRARTAHDRLRQGNRPPALTTAAKSND
jgi:NADPH:quinone reductase